MAGSGRVQEEGGRGGGGRYYEDINGETGGVFSTPILAPCPSSA